MTLYSYSTLSKVVALSLPSKTTFLDVGDFVYIGYFAIFDPYATFPYGLSKFEFFLKPILSFCVSKA